MESTTTYQIGEKLAYTSHRGWSTQYHFSTVAKITPTGIIVTANGIRFNTDGWERTSQSHYRYFLCDYDEASAYTANQKQQRETDDHIDLLLYFIKKTKYTNGHEIDEIQRSQIVELAKCIPISPE